MMFVSVGTQLPFPRMMAVIDEWAAHNSDVKVFAQTADDTLMNYVEAVDYLSAKAFQGYFSEADVIVSHAGMGNILTALEMEKPIVIFPRKAELNEHRNDHQVSTAKKFFDHPYVFVVNDIISFTESLVDIALLQRSSGVKVVSNTNANLNKFLLDSVNEWF